MELIQNIIGWAILLLILYLMRRPIFRFFRNAGNNAYQRAVAWGGAIIFLVVIALLVFLLTGGR